MKVSNDIRKFLLRNSIVTYGCVAITIATLYFHFSTTSKAIAESREYLYVISTEGEIIPMKYKDRREAVTIEIKHHLNMFVDAFYTLNKDNWERKAINQAFNLADVENIHTDRANKGYYNRFIQYNIEQTAVLQPENIELTMVDKDNFDFKIIIDMEENYQGVITKYAIFARGKAKVSDRHFPNNPHGIWVHEYVEDRIQKIIEE